jgi:biotin-dependent carboxylase-like uncharacterized protein
MEILSAGTLTTVQDAGRTGHAAAGYPQSGACDEFSMRLANLLAGNTDNAAVLEYTLHGPTLRFDDSALIALGGADCGAMVNAEALPLFRPRLVQRGDMVALGTAKTGLRGYLAVLGGIKVPAVLGSRSTSLKCHLGGLEGRALRSGDRLSCGVTPRQTALRWKQLLHTIPNAAEPQMRWLLSPTHPRRFEGGTGLPVLRAVPGPQSEAFTSLGLSTFSRGVYTLTADCNRMACKLSGPAIETVNGSDILSDGIVSGSVQVSSNGQPIVMLADHQTTGGYAKIATVLRVDLPVLAQLRPGEKVCFRFVSVNEAIETFRREVQAFRWLKECIKP